MDRMKIAEELRIAKGDIITAEGVALRSYLPPDEQRTILAAMARRAHLHIIAVYKELAVGDAEELEREALAAAETACGDTDKEHAVA